MCLSPLNLIRLDKGEKLRPANDNQVDVAPRPEKTAKSPVLGRKRTVSKKSSKTKAARRFGTRSLRIPLMNTGDSELGNLNY